MAAKQDQEWFDYSQAAQYLNGKVPGGFTVRYVMKAKAANELHFAKIRGRVWFSKSDLDSYVTKVTTTGAHT